MHRFVRDLNLFYLKNTPFWQEDLSWDGFGWISPDDAEKNVISFRRIDSLGNEIIVVCNFCPVKRTKYRIGVFKKGKYKCVFSSDKIIYGGTGARLRSVNSQNIKMHGYENSISLTLPAMSVCYYKLTE